MKHPHSVDLRRTTSRISPMVALMTVGLALARPAEALLFNITYDSSVGSAPVGFTTAVQDAAQLYESTYTNPITINLDVGWGEVGGQALSSGALGESQLSISSYRYQQVQSALQNNQAVLPSMNPATSITVSLADSQALGLTSGNTSQLAGTVGFSSSTSWSFSPTATPPSGSYYFSGVAAHEISEVMGRFSMLDSSGESVLDLFRYTAPGTLQTTHFSSGTSYPASYFSIDGGKTAINSFNGNPTAGDLGDWAGSTVDAFNYQATSGEILPVTSGDLTEMSALGYTPVPVPSSLIFMTTGLGLMGLSMRRKRRPNLPG